MLQYLLSWPMFLTPDKASPTISSSCKHFSYKKGIDWAIIDMFQHLNLKIQIFLSIMPLLKENFPPKN